MQVRRKCFETLTVPTDLPTQTFLVLDESPDYYIVEHGQALPKQLYEPTMEWVDVTSECEVTEGGDVFLKPFVAEDVLFERMTNLYRLRKIRFLNDRQEEAVAFIVEQKSVDTFEVVVGRKK